MISRRNLLGAVVLGGAVTPVLADPLARQKFESFLKNAVSASGRFTQTVTDRAGREAVAPSTGHFRFLRPGCFEWVYEKPYEQQIVSDGKTLWLYDPDLLQVTIKSLEGNLPATPAAILFGNESFAEHWHFKKLSEKTIEVTPENSESGFEKMMMEIDESGELETLTLVDNFGQIARLEFFDLVREPIDRNSFTFEIPEGADVLRDGAPA